jgi:hypothetical protein
VEGFEDIRVLLNPWVLQTLLNFLTSRATIGFSIRTLHLKVSHNLIEVVKIYIYIHISK